MDAFKPTTYTPFLRRFTDERLRDERELSALYAEVLERHRRSPYAEPEADVRVASRIYEYLDAVPDILREPFAGTLLELVRLETTLFVFPEVKWGLAQLSLKEQVDLQRFLIAKRHFLTNHERVVDLLQRGLLTIFTHIFDDVAELVEPSPFSIPYILTHPAPKELLDSLYSVLWSQPFIDNGIFVELSQRMYANLCAVSKINDPHKPKRPFKMPTENDLPVVELVHLYLKGTPFVDLLLMPVPLRLTHEDRFSHMHVLGGSGAGKTQLLQRLILHDLLSDDPPALIVVDSQTDLISKLVHLDLFAPEGGALHDRLIYLTPRDIAFPPALNIFDVNRERLGGYDQATKEQVVAGVIQTFDYLFDGLIGADLTAKQRVFFRFVARLMLALPETLGRPATILDLMNLMDDSAPYQAAIETLPPIQRQFFERDFLGKGFIQTRDQIRYRLNAVLENPTFARLFTAPRTRIDLFSALNNNAIVLVDTAKDFLKGASAHFGQLFISLVLQAVMERAAIPEHERKPAFLIVDEAAAYFDSNIDDLLTEARKYKLGCVFAHQFLDQASSALRASLFANTSIKMASGVASADARAMAAEMRTAPDFILNQPRLQFAAHVRNVTPHAVSIPVEAGLLERQPRLSTAEYEALLVSNRAKVSLPPALAAPPRTSSDVFAKASRSAAEEADPAAPTDW